jgi:SNF2 family DNA or RNA helicase
VKIGILEPTKSSILIRTVTRQTMSVTVSRVGAMRTSKPPVWVVSDFAVVDLTKESGENRVSSELFWESRTDDFTSNIGLNIEGYGSLEFEVDARDQLLKLKVKTQNRLEDITGIEKFPLDHVVCGNSWVPLSAEECQRYIEFLNHNKIIIGSLVEFPDFLNLLAGRNQNQIKVNFMGNLNFLTDSLITEPRNHGLAIPPYPYQVKGIDWLCSIRAHGAGAILGDEMGLGKTVQLLGLVANELKIEQQPKVLVVVPSSLKLNWLSEFSKFLPNVVPYVHSGPDRERIPSRIAQHDVVITTYPIVNRDWPTLSKMNWTLVVCDEAHVMKNPTSVTRTSIQKFNSAPIFLSTGTPLENNLMDLWSLTDLIRPGIMGSLNQVKNLMEGQLSEAEAIGDLVRPLILRRLVRNVLPDLPDIVEKTHWIEPSYEFTRDYQAVKGDPQASGASGSKFGLITKLRQFCTYPPMVGKYMIDLPDAKVDMLLDLLDRVSQQEEKAIIFTSWHDSADFLVRLVLQAYPGVYCTAIDGREASDERFPKIVDFQKIEGFAVLVCNTRAAGEGLNIVAANHVVHFDRQWNPAKEAQATARSHRIGQKKTVFVHKLIYSGTIEEVIDDRLLLKAYLAQQTLNPAVQEEDDKSIAEALGVTPIYVNNGV